MQIVQKIAPRPTVFVELIHLPSGNVHQSGYGEPFPVWKIGVTTTAITTHLTALKVIVCANKCTDVKLCNPSQEEMFTSHEKVFDQQF